jgi:hypothetical protein
MVPGAKQTVWDWNSRGFVVARASGYGRGAMHTETPAPPAATDIGRDLAPFEQLMLVEERPGFPMCFFVECRVAGPLDEHRLRRAVAAAAGRHPLVCSRVAGHASRPRWLSPDVRPALVWLPRTGDPWNPLDLTRESGVRLVVLSDGPGRHRVVMQVHHATCDGIAACEFFGDIWAIYAGLEPRPFSRGRSGVRASAAAPASGAATRDFAMFLPAPLARRPARAGASPGSPAVEPPYATIQFDAPFTARLRSAAADHGTSLNDVLVAAVMRAVVSWNAAAGRRGSNVRITMPVSMRPVGTRSPAGNAISYAFLDRRADDCGELAGLAASIGSATRWILETNAAAAFLDTLGWLTRRPLLLKLLTRLPVCLSSVVFSNVGDASRRMRIGAARPDGRDAPGNVLIEGFIGVPPLRPRTLAAVGGTTYANALALTCLCAAAPDARAGAAAFLELIRDDLERFVAAG